MDLNPKPPRVKDLAGQRFGNQVVEGFYDQDKNRNARWMVRCGCGYSRPVTGATLTAGQSTNCGCSRDGMNSLPDALRRHPLYSTWLGMRERCSSPNSAGYYYYGGRGIKVCDRWQNSFTNFLADMGEKPSPELTLDRINNDGDYAPQTIVDGRQ